LNDQAWLGLTCLCWVHCKFRFIPPIRGNLMLIKSSERNTGPENGLAASVWHLEHELEAPISSSWSPPSGWLMDSLMFHISGVTFEWSCEHLQTTRCLQVLTLPLNVWLHVALDACCRGRTTNPVALRPRLAEISAHVHPSC
jgi:hypothetical protein